MSLYNFRTVLLFGVLTGIFLAFGALLGGKAGLTIALFLALIMNFLTYWFSDKLVLFMYGAKEAKRDDYSELYGLVRGVADRAGLPMPRVYIMKNSSPNAFATGRNYKNAVVAVTTGIIDLLTEKELKGVIAHEMAHIKNRDMLVSTIAAVIAGAISYLAMFARFSAFGGDENRNGNLIGVILLALLAPIIAMLVHLAISRSREFLADETGARIIRDPNSLADALQKLSGEVRRNPMKKATEGTAHMFIVNPLSGESILKWFSTHPPIIERVGKLRGMSVSKF